MKKINLMLSLVVFIFSSQNVYSIVVTDPASYLYMMEQLKSAKNQYDAVEQGNATSDQTLNEVISMKDKLTGSYNKTMDAVNNAKRLTKTLSRETMSLKRGLALSKENGGKFKDMESYLDSLFSDPRYADNESSEIKNLRYNAKQRAYKNTILVSEKIMKGQKERLKNLDNLAAEIDRTNNVKESTDLTNRILVEVVRLNIEMLAINLALTEAYGLQNYTGLKGSDNKKQIDAIKGKNPKKSISGTDRLRERAKTIPPMSEWGKINMDGM